MNHKRGRPKHQRAGCLTCKPEKSKRTSKGTRATRAAPAVRRRTQDKLPRASYCQECGGEDTVVDKLCGACGACS